MLSQKLATFLALIIFASQGAMAAPYNPRSPDDLSATAGTLIGDIALPTLPKEFINSGIQGATGDPVPEDSHPDGATDELLKDGGRVVGSTVAEVSPELANAGIKAAEKYYKYVNDCLVSIPYLLTFLFLFFFSSK